MRVTVTRINGKKTHIMLPLSTDHWRCWSAFTDLTASTRAAACMASHHQQLLTPCSASPAENSMLVGSGTAGLTDGFWGWTAWGILVELLCSALCCIQFSHTLYSYSELRISISPCNTTDVARAGCFFLPFHCHFPTALELGWRRNPQSTESCSGYPTFVYLFFPSSFSLKLFRPPLKRNGASLERAASQCEKHCFGEREKIHDFKREKHSQFNKRRP